MVPSPALHRTGITAVLTFAVAMPLAARQPPQQRPQQRPMTWMDVQLMNRPGAWTPSPDGGMMLYTVSYPDWEEADSQSDLHVVSMTEGVASSRRLTFTTGSDETDPAWAPDGSFFVFISDREPGEDGLEGEQLWAMRIGGGEAWRITTAPEGVRDFGFSPDGTWLVYRSGESGKE
ncbi:MAG TPA: hypothetical protein VE173_09610, partial [Longimicrobiales bacterium]|nr:hypothetical protein [Longimicrobiales bacterium]